MAARLRPDPSAEPIQHSRETPCWILRGLTSKDRIGQRRDGNKEEVGVEGKMEKRGREERGGERKEEKEGMGACTHWNFRKLAPMVESAMVTMESL